MLLEAEEVLGEEERAISPDETTLEDDVSSEAGVGVTEVDKTDVGVTDVGVTEVDKVDAPDTSIVSKTEKYAKYRPKPKMNVRFKEPTFTDESKFLNRHKYLNKKQQEFKLQKSHIIHVQLWLLSNQKNSPNLRGIGCSFHDCFTNQLSFWEDEYRHRSFGFAVYCESELHRERIMAMTNLGQIIILAVQPEKVEECFDLERGSPYRLKEMMTPRQLLSQFGALEIFSSYGLYF